MKTHLKKIMLVVTLAFTIGSCSSDNDDNASGSSRDVKYEVTGNFTGKLSTTYMEKGGNALSEDINALPWVKEFTAEPKSSGATISAGGYGGVDGQTITVKMYVGGKIVNELTAKANSDGIVTASLTAHVFPL